MCSAVVKLTVASDFKSASFSNPSLLLIDATLFNDFDLESLEYGEKCSEFSICILPSDLPEQLVNYVEKSFRYIISFPVNIEYFQGFCSRVISSVSKLHKDYISTRLEQKSIPDSISGFFGGESNIIKNIRSQILTAAYSKKPVLILGETGVGKTTAANEIHKLSERKNRKMVYVDPAVISGTLAESAFFGHARGSFTDAAYERHGYLEEANGSSLFFDEFGVASLTVQTILLPVLETGNYKRMGDNREYHTDVRMIFATNANLDEMMKTGKFRKDLYHRINDNLICIPPLRSHKEDIRGMVTRYIGPDKVITEDAMERLENYSWPGNIRELHKCLNRALLDSSSKMITADAICFKDISFPQ